MALLVASKADVNMATANGYTPLHCLFTTRDCLLDTGGAHGTAWGTQGARDWQGAWGGVVRQLVGESGELVNQVTSDGSSVLHLALRGGATNASVIEYMLRRNADIDQTSVRTRRCLVLTF